MTPPSPPEGDYFRLRAEWLRFKNHVFDANTELPTLAAVLDDVRRLMEERGTVGIIYLDLGGDGLTEPLHGWRRKDRDDRLLNLGEELLIERLDDRAVVSGKNSLVDRGGCSIAHGVKPEFSI